uniref:Ribosomal protein L16 n=1 Tax=Tsukubamonas globosa TaxID=875863 RepID=W8VTG4_9EUKA|nr:ribosomal protein L16 [Tsukubamonas globosa]BAO51953.1 ribosomal protein L16 [Tsukubamonas globosa]
MLLSPKKRVFQKSHKGPIGGISCTSHINFGKYALVAETSGRITARQIEAARKTINRRIKKIGKLWIRIFPDLPVSSKPNEVRMGKGKGSVDYWVCKVKAGRVLFELSDVAFDIARASLLMGSNKLPITTKFITK